MIAWAFELTPEGMKRTEDVDPAATGRHTVKSHAWIYIVSRRGVFVGLFFLSVATRPEIQRPPGGYTLQLPQKSIAVLPFVNMSADKENEFFADGLSEEILNSLARIDGMRVVGRTSSFQFKGKAEDLRAIGEKLGVPTCSKAACGVKASARITAQLDPHLRWHPPLVADLRSHAQGYAGGAARYRRAGCRRARRRAGRQKQREEMRAAGVKNVDAFIAIKKD